MKNKYIPEYLEEINKNFEESCEGLKEVCKKLDLILEAIYGEEETESSVDNEIKDTEPNADNQPAPKKRGPKPKK